MYSRFRLIIIKKDLDKKNAGVECQDGGRHEDENLMHWFRLLINWLDSESGAELYTLSEFHSKMAEGSDAYNIKKWFKRKLQEHYKEHIFFSTVEGQDDVVCFKNMANYVINHKWQSSKG